MSFDLKHRGPLFLWLGSLALIAFCVLGGAEVRADTIIKANLHVCVQADGAPITNAHVVRKGGQLVDVELQPDAKEKGCYVRADVPFGSKFTYRLEIKADGYPDKTVDMDTANVKTGDTVGPNAPIVLTKPGQVPPPTVAKGVRVCLKGSDGAPVTNARVVLKGGTSDLGLQPEAQEKSCYRSGDGDLESAKTYSLEIKADGYNDRTEQLDISKFNEVGVAGPSGPLELTKTVSRWPTTLVIVIIVVPIILLAVLLIGVWKAVRPKKSKSDIHAASDVETKPHPFVVALENLAAELQGIKTQQEKQTHLFERILERLERDDDKDKSERERETDRKATHTDYEAESQYAPVQVVGNQDGADRPRGEDLAKSSYENFLHGRVVSPEPIYLQDVGGSSPEDTLGRRQAVLEVSDRQGAIVLIRNADSEDGGWLYPNIELHYHEAALRKVFPLLSEADFKLIKQNRSLKDVNIEPVHVKKFGSCWQVGSS